MNENITYLSPHRRRLILALLALLLLMKHRMDKRKRLRQHHHHNDESTYGDEESTHREDEKCAWRTRDREHQLTMEEGRRRLEKWTQEQDGIFERFYGGDGGRVGMARHAYAYAYAVPLSTVPQSTVPVLPRLVDEGPAPKRRAVLPVPREVKVEQTLGRRMVPVPAFSKGGEVGLATGRGSIRKIRKRRIGEARFGVKMQFEIDDACALSGRGGKGRQGVRGGPLAGWGGLRVERKRE
ncbi:hypothetical protein VE00_02884 [Pseudogymnoascus sp. WSF 3629]|nr:hypothetical protein VE00_02884 [Pseudogymnoascus sp. WSF 3629]